MQTSVFPRGEYSLFVTNAPFELNGFVPTVNADSYEKVGVDEQVTYYIAKQKPEPIIDGLEFVTGNAGDWYEDDYTKVRVFDDRIVFVVK